MITSDIRFANWRIGVCGSSHTLPPAAAELCEAVGEQLAGVANVKIVHMGLKRRAGAAEGNYAANWHFIVGAKRIAPDRLNERIETIVSNSNNASPATASPISALQTEGSTTTGEFFIEGAAHQINATTRQARRFQFVNSLDGMIAIGGGVATREQLTLASAIEIPTVPVPCVAGAAQTFWSDNRGQLIRSLGIDETTAQRWEQTPRTDAERNRLAADIVHSLLARLPRRCFVIMPYDPQFDTLYDLIIEPAVTSLANTILRLDRLHQPGGIIQQIEDGIRSADYCIVVLDGMRPNVLYEMGMAHALGKPLVLLMQRGSLGNEAHVPFDISTLQRIEYERPDRRTLETLRAALSHLGHRSADQPPA